MPLCFRSTICKLLIVCAAAVHTASFSPVLKRTRTSVNGAASRRRDDDDDLYRDALALNKARTDIRNFLTQRAIQSFVGLLIHCRDEATVRWLEKKYEFQNLDSFHGTAAFNLTKYPAWDSILTDMIFQPPDVVIISAKRRGRGHGGWSKDNPYLEERFVDFEIDIDPPSLVSRIVSVRDQIAAEWTADLETLRAANEMILDSYYVMLSSQRFDDVPAVAEDDASSESADCASLTAPYSGATYKQSVHNEQSRKAYDRTAMMVLGNNIVQDGLASSPYRRGSFDLLGLLATQESIHRVLRNYREAGEERDVSFQWLRDFYVARVVSHFDGNQEYGRADDFLEELLLTSPSVKEMDGKIGLIDPMRIAEDIIAMRSEVAHDWRDIVVDVPSKDHTELRKHSLAIRMGKTIERSPSFEELQAGDEGFQ